MGGPRNSNSVTVSVDARDGTPEVALERRGEMPASARIAVTGEGPRLLLRGANGATALLELNRDGHPILVLRGPGDEPVVTLSAAEDGPRVSLARKAGGRRAECTVLPDGTPRMSLADDSGRITTIITMDNEGKVAVQRTPP